MAVASIPFPRLLMENMKGMGTNHLPKNYVLKSTLKW